MSAFSSRRFEFGAGGGISRKVIGRKGGAVAHGPRRGGLNCRDAFVGRPKPARCSVFWQSRNILWEVLHA